jgi:hypothetical protein
MKAKIFLIIFLSVFFIPLAFALNVCETPINIQEPCSMLTPIISCSDYNYTIFYENKSVYETGNLTLFAENIYYFNLSLPTGSYIIKLCDGSTKQVFIGGKNMSLALIIGIGIISFLFIYVGLTIKNERLNPLRLLLLFSSFVFLLFIPLSFITGNIGISFYKAVITIFIVFGSMISIYVLYLVLDLMKIIPRKRRK